MDRLWCIALIPKWTTADSPKPLAAADFQAVTQSLGNSLGPSILNLIGAIAILILFWIGATIIAGGIKAILSRTDLDNRVANWAMGTQRGENEPPVEQWISAAVYWIVLLFGLVAFLNALNLQVVSAPINAFLGQIFSYLPRLGAAAVLFGVAWLLATVSKSLLLRGLSRFRLDDRLAEQTGEESPFLVNETLANALYWFIFLFFLPLILDALELQGPLEPVQDLMSKILLYLPNIITAVIIGVVGWFVAKIVRGLVTNLLSAGGIDRLGQRLGLNQTQGMSLSSIAGTIVYVLILIPIAIAALNALKIEAISAPAISMLEQILDTLPQIFTAIAILVVFYIIGRYVAAFVSSILTGLGFNGIFSALGLQGFSQPAPQTIVDDENPYNPPTTTRTPSEWVGLIVWVGIMLFATVAAVEVLDFAALNAIVAGLLLIFGKILAGLVVFAIGLYLANLAYRLVLSSGTSNAQFLGQFARVAIIIFVAAMALQQMGIAPNIVNLAFGLLLGAIAVAIALAFGLGGRDIAADEIRSFLSSFRKPTAKPTAKQPPRSDV
ncbi:MAG TPA: mechanosensitive ion channel [Oscillatoriales cyanobacterium M59_W2019_021]|nr:mechanosensitive ion channel [Oscillatoriales cyanobacterium M4454_W2019_049]HIK52567.1 mechanosensitive ion channel [Oscillatoriales cyanobacterium M59_W2019_021]